MSSSNVPQSPQNDLPDVEGVILPPKPEPEEDDGEEEELEQPLVYEMPAACQVLDPSDDEDLYDPAIEHPDVRLSLKHQTRLDKILLNIPHPEGSIPPTAFPGWEYLPMDQKLPKYLYLPDDFFTRDKLGRDLRRNSNVFHLEKSPTSLDNYTALHDPTTLNYLKNPAVLKQLIRLGLVTSEGRVICTQKEFNQYREYLKTIYMDDVKKVIAHDDECARERIIQERRIRQFEKENSCERDLKLLMAKQKKCEAHVEKVKRIQESIRIKDEKARRAKQTRECIQLEKILTAVEKEKAHANLRKCINDEECQRKKALITKIVEKEKAANERRERDKALVKDCLDQYKCEWLKAKWNAGGQARDAQLRAALRQDLKRKAAQRQTRVENYRKMMPEFIEQKKREKARILGIVAKYFYRWLNKCRERKLRRPDERHMSLWDVKTSVDDTNKFLKKQSGYETLDDFVMDIMRLKQGNAERNDPGPEQRNHNTPTDPAGE